MIPKLQVGKGELLAVPAVHNRSIFAEMVNRTCLHEVTRPEAIAVELSQDTVDAVVAWFRELGVGAGKGGTIPCMLGLAKGNQRIHPRFKQDALRLQETYCTPLHRIPSTILHKELNFSPLSLVCLNTTDSIIEGIRCAVELDIPVYGVDLGRTTAGIRNYSTLQDPLFAQDDMERYVEFNAPFCVPHRDDVVDERRERVMAARLKRLLREYRRVLFTCGIGHWHLLSKRLADPATETATAPSMTEGEQIRRVLVHPSVAIYQMDLLPALATHYESVRISPPDAPERMIDFGAICRSNLFEACERIETGNLELLPGFHQYLANRSLLDQRRAPGLFAMISAAREMVSESFAERLGHELVIESLDWATQARWPDLPCISAAQHDLEDQTGIGMLVEINEKGHDNRRCCIDNRPDDWNPDNDCPFPFHFDSRDQSDKNENHTPVHYWVWPPCETLLHGTAYAAMDIVDHMAQGHNAEPFWGSLHDGVDVKATLRAAIRGENRIQVKTPSITTRANAGTEGDDEPTVFIFEHEADVNDGQWGMFQAGLSHQLQNLVENKREYENVISQRGGHFIASVQFDMQPRPEKHLKPHVKIIRYLYGITVFGNPSLNPLQSARWLEACNYARCPVLRNGSVSTLFDYYASEHGITLDEERWGMSLVRIALPFAKRRVTVLLPKSVRLDPTVQHEARKRGVRLDCVPLSHFPKERIRTIRNQYFVQPDDVNSMEYPEDMQAALGESPRSHLELLPERIRAQLKQPPRLQP